MSTQNIVEAKAFQVVQRELPAIEKSVKGLMPSGSFVFVGMDNKHIYFNILSNRPTREEMGKVRNRSFFEPLKITYPAAHQPYIGQFRCKINM